MPSCKLQRRSRNDAIDDTVHQGCESEEISVKKKIMVIFYFHQVRKWIFTSSSNFKASKYMASASSNLSSFP